MRPSTLLKRVLSLIVSAAAALTFTSSRSTAPRYHYEVRRDLSVYFKNADSVIESVRGSLRRRSDRIIISYTSHGDNMEDMSELVREVMELALSETDRPDEGDCLRFQMGGYSLDYGYVREGGDYHYEVTVSPDYYTDLSQEQAVSERVGEIVRGFGFDGSTTELEKLRAVHDYLCENVEYDDIHKHNEHYHLKSTAYGALINGHAVCQGYAAAAYRLLRELGVSCRVVTGMAELDGEKEFHAWNIAAVDGKYYNMDITWDDQLSTEDYFLRSDADLHGHTRDEEYASREFYEICPMAENSIG